MMDRESPLILSADIFPDMTTEEIEIEINAMFNRSKAIRDAISGKIPARELCEIVEANGINIDEWSITCDDVAGSW